MINNEINGVLKINAQNLKEILMQFSNIDDANKCRNEIMHQFGLDQVDSFSSVEDIKRYNQFVRAWNKQLKEIFKPLEMTEVKRACEEALKRANENMAVMKAEHDAEISEMKSKHNSEIIDLNSELSDLKTQIASLAKAVNTLK